MRKFGLFLFLSMLAVGIHAQELTEQELQVKEDSIFNIKFGEESHYAETVVEIIMEDDAKVTAAKQQSMYLLQTHIIEIFSKCLNMKNEDVQEIWDLIEEKGCEIEIKKGDLYKICKYIAKDALKGWFGSKKVKPISPEDSLILFGPKETKIFEEREIKIENTKVSPANEEDTNAGKTEVNVVSTEEQEKAKKEAEELKRKEEEERLRKEAEERKRKEEEERRRKIEEEKLKKDTPDLCREIMKKNNFQTLMNFLTQEKTYGRLMFGNAKDMHNLEECYVVILEREGTQNIVAVLGKGISERMNFMTKKMDNYKLYDKNKYAIVFVQELNN